DFGESLTAAGAGAGAARLVHDPSAAFTTGTGLGNAENAARTDDLAASAASGAGFCDGALLRPAAVAGVALAHFRDGDFLFATLGGFHESQFHVIAQIVAALRAAGPAFAAA